MREGEIWYVKEKNGMEDKGTCVFLHKNVRSNSIGFRFGAIYQYVLPGTGFSRRNTGFLEEKNWQIGGESLEASHDMRGVQDPMNPRFVFAAHGKL